MSPSTRPALSRVGVFAARVIWARVRPWALRISRPSRASCTQLMPLSFLNCRVRRSVGPSRRTALVSSTSSTNGVRSIRCGIPSTLVVTTVPVRSVREVELLDRVGDGGVLGQQEAGAHADRGGAVRQRRGEAAPVEEAASRDDRDVHGVQHGRQQQRGRDRAGVAAALAALDHHRVRAPAGHLDRVLRGADRRHHDDPVVLELLDQLRLGRQRERRHLDAVLDQEVAAVARRRPRRRAG